MINEPTPTRTAGRRSGSVVAALVVALLVALGACANQPIDGERPPISSLPTDPEAPPATETPAPPETEAPPPPETEAPAPPATEAPPAATPDDPENAEQDGLSTEDWLLLALIAIAVILVVALIASWAGQRGQQQAAADAERRRRLAAIVGECQWLHDQVSLELLGTQDPAYLASSWTSTRPRVDANQRTIGAMAAADPALAPQLEQLGSANWAIRNSLDTYVRLRSAPDTDPQLAQAAAQSVSNTRNQLMAALAPFTAPTYT